MSPHTTPLWGVSIARHTSWGEKKKKNNHTNPGLRWPGTVFFTHSGINLVGYDYAGVCKYGELIYTLCRPWMAFPCKYYNPMFLLIHFEIYLWSVLLGV